MSEISFNTTLEKVGRIVLARVPEEASQKLPSRGMVVVEGSVNGAPMKVALEPDGRGGHWFELDGKMRKALNVGVGDSVKLEVEPTKDWPEPSVPNDLSKALSKNPRAKNVWDNTTTIARWDWIRSIRSTNNPATRQKRVKVACSKLESGKTRQCCFNRNMCTIPEVAKNGVLLSV